MAGDVPIFHYPIWQIATSLSSPSLVDTERQLQFAWLAGIVDGEGHIGLHRKKSGKQRKDGTITMWMGYAPALVVAMNSEKVCRLAQEITGVGTVGPFERLSKNGQVHWRWRARYRQASVALKMLLPYLVEKRDQAELVIRATEINTGYQKERKWRNRLTERADELEKIASELHALHGTAHRTLTLEELK